MRFFVTLLSSLLLAGVLWSQPIDAPHNDRGFSANKVFEVGEIDSISPFDGNLILNIPIGGDYPLRPGFSYGLALFYNGKVWEVEYRPDPPSDYYRTYEPYRGFNAGVGWTLTLGQLLEPAAAINDGNSLWTYVGPDGSKHDFFTELHPGESQSGSSFTRDNSYLRMRMSDSQRVVEMPDGSRHFFENPGDGTGIWRLVRLEDAFGNWMQVAYTATKWTITDMHGRTHEVHFSSAADPLDRVVEEVRVAQFGSSAPAVWDFVYDDISLEPSECGLTSDPLDNRRFDIKFLSRIDRPDGSSFEMPDYAIATDQEDCNPTTGRIRSLTLPTGGELEWEYGAYTMPQETCFSCDGIPFTPPERITGVHERRHRSPSGALLGTWTYAPAIDAAIEGSERTTTVTQPAPLEHQTVYYFSIHRHTQAVFADDWTRYEYGLPLTHNRRLADDFPDLPGAASRPDLYLSREVFDGSGQLLRSVYVRYVYVRYVKETPVSTDLSVISNANRRVQHELTIYHDHEVEGDIGFIETIYSDFDGLGHYRTQTRRGNFSSIASIEAKEMHTEWNAARGELITDESTGQQTAASTFSLPPAGGRWILGTSTYTEYRQGSAVRRINRTFRDDGFLECRRSLANGAGESGNDLLQIFADGDAATDPDGQMDSESWYGGDDQSLTDVVGCQEPAFQPEYKTVHTYAAGALESSTAVKSTPNIRTNRRTA